MNKNGNKYISVNIYLKWKRIKCSNQKIERLNGKENKTPACAAYKRLSSPQMKRHTQTKRKGMEKDIAVMDLEGIVPNDVR